MAASTLRTLVAMLVLCTVASAAAGSTAGYRTEFHPPVKGAEGVYTLDVIFSRRVAAGEAERILRRELGAALRKSLPKGDILATAWYSPTGKEIDEDIVTLPDGSQHLIYSRRLKKIQTFGEYEHRKGR